MFGLEKSASSNKLTRHETTDKSLASLIYFWCFSVFGAPKMFPESCLSSVASFLLEDSAEESFFSLQ